jgi:hypothetical protein
MSIRWVQRAAWVLVGIGVVVAALSVGGLAHPTGSGTPSSASTGTDHGRMVLGFALSMAGAAVLVVSEAFRGRGRRRRVPGGDGVGAGGAGR